MSDVTTRLRAFTIAAVLAGAALTSAPAQAGWHGGFFIGLPPVVVAPGPVAYPYYYPPAYYPPPYYGPGYYPPPAYPYPPPDAQAPQASAPPASAPQSQSNAQASNGSAPVAYGSMCYAGVYQCAAPTYSPIGQTCSCPGIGAPSYGTVR